MIPARNRMARFSLLQSATGIDDGDVEEVVDQLLAVGDALRDARVVITGATGWFGVWLLDCLVALNRRAALDLRIVAISRSPAAFKERWPSLYGASEIEWITGDVRDVRLRVIGPVTHVIHAAADTRAGPDARVTAETIVDGTRNILALASRNPRCRFLFVSSGAVYGQQSNRFGSFVESEPLHSAVTDDPYTVGKRAAERLVLASATAPALETIVARCFAFVGPHMPFDAHFAIGNFIRDATAGGPIEIQGDGKPLRSFMYMADLTVWLVTLLIRGEPSRVYNVGSPDAVSIEALARQCAELGEQGPSVLIHAKAGPGRNYVPDVSRAMTELGVRVRVPLQEAIHRTMRWRRRSMAMAMATAAATAAAMPHR